LDYIEKNLGGRQRPGIGISTTSRFDLMSEQTPRSQPSGASAEAISYHYDVGTEFYRLWLDRNLTYSAARWGDPHQATASPVSLELAQEAKLDFHLKAAGIGPGDSLLDIGCGWGSMLRRAVEQYGVAEATGLTLSSDQYNYVRALDLPGVEVRLENYEDYRPASKFTGIVSVGAFEHFTRPGLSAAEKVAIYRRFFERCHGWLNRGAHLSLQSITWGNVPRDRSSLILAQDVFPETDPPYLTDVLEASVSTFEPIYLENRRNDYIQTLQVWLERLRARQREIEAMTSTQTFVFYERYLRGSIYRFKKKELQLCRFVFRRH
jgi:cyclopropane-fatty-acyl-phospholipid synthase